MICEAPKNILIIEDDDAIRDALTELLEIDGYQVASVSNGRAGLDHLRSAPLPRLILLDLMMPLMNGCEFRHEQKQDPRIAHIPVVAISADSSIQRKARDIEAVAYLDKPFHVKTVREIIARCFS